MIPDPEPYGVIFPKVQAADPKEFVQFEVRLDLPFVCVCVCVCVCVYVYVCVC
jgi:hypothetical protein